MSDDTDDYYTDEKEQQVFAPESAVKRRSRSSRSHPAPEPASIPASMSSARERIVSAFTGGTPLDTKTELMMRAIAEAYELREDDPLWIVLIPALLRGADALQQRELVAAIGELRDTLTGKGGLSVPLKSLERTINEQMQELFEAVQENGNAIAGFAKKLQKSVESGVLSALDKRDDDGLGGSRKGEAAAIADQVLDGIRSYIVGGKTLFLIGVAALMGAFGFMFGVWYDKFAYAPYVAVLETKAAACEARTASPAPLTGEAPASKGAKR